MREKEYRELVLAEYDRQKKVGLLPPELQVPTRSGLRDHCIKVSKERYEKKDEPLFQSFYGQRNSPAEYLIAIKNAEAEDFRNLNNFINGRKGTAFLNVCMLAWIIDYEYRPYREDLKIPVTTLPEKELVTEFPTLVTEDEKTPIKLADQRKLKGLWVYISAATLACMMVYHIASLKLTQNTKKDGCMVWTGTQYQKVSCSYQPPVDAISAVPLDTALLKNFKKIINEDTLTAASIGRVWCVKIEGNYEYYTDSASVPEHPEKHLRPLTTFIMNNNH